MTRDVGARRPTEHAAPAHDLSRWRHDHAFDAGNPAGERSTRIVTALTLATMAVEIGAGWWFNSMALLADGLHMSSHALALGLTAFAYTAARRLAQDRRFAFGTWKIEVLAGFASALALLFVIALMVAGSVERLWSPQTIHYREAIAVAAIGLAVNLACALVLGRANVPPRGGAAAGAVAGPVHDHDHDQHHHHGLHRHAAAHAHAGRVHEDLNLRSAYVHVLTDAATSVLALIALAGGWAYGWDWLDPAMGLVGAAIIVPWARRLLTDTGKVLLDREMDHPVVDQIRSAIEVAGADSQTLVTDLHVWRVGRASYSCAVSVVTHDPALTPARVRAWLAARVDVAHATIEIERCAQPHG